MTAKKCSNCSNLFKCLKKRHIKYSIGLEQVGTGRHRLEQFEHLNEKFDGFRKKSKKKVFFKIPRMKDDNSTIDWCPLWSTWISASSRRVAINVGRVMEPHTGEILSVKVVDLATRQLTEVPWTDWKSWYESGKIIRYLGSFQSAS